MRLASAGTDGLIKLWDAANGHLVATHYGHNLDVGCVAFTADGDTILSGGHDNTLRFWDASEP